MTSTLMVIQIALAIIITIAVLLQKSSSIGLGAYTSSNESVFGAKGPAGFLAKFTSIAALLFVINTLALGYYYSQQNGASSIKVSDSDSSAVATNSDANGSANADANTSTKDVSTDENKTKIVINNQDGTTITATASSAQTENTKEQSGASANSNSSGQEVAKLTKEEEQAAIISDINSNKTSNKAHILKGVSFNTGSTTLAQSSTEQIDAIVTALKSNPNVKIMLRGHTDNVGSSQGNMALSQKRADSLKAEFVSKGIDASRISTEGKGDSDPIASNDTKEGRILNRRVDIAVVN